MTFEQETKEMEAEINWLNKLTVLKERKTEMKNKEMKNDNQESRNKVKIYIYIRNEKEGIK